MTSRLLDLPPELALAILVFLDARSLVACKTVCSRFLKIITNDTELQYIIELFSVGMIDNHNSSPSTGTIWPNACLRLQTLKSFLQIRNGLYDLRNYSVDGFRVINQDSQTDAWCPSLVIKTFSSHDIQAGIEGNHEWQDGRDYKWRYFPGILSWKYGPHFHFVKLPGKMRGVAMKTWKLDLRTTFGNEGPAADDRAVSYRVDVHQDLLILMEKPARMEFKVHFLSLTTGKRHPSAHSPVHTLWFGSEEAEDPDWSTSYSIVTYDHHIAISISSDSSTPQLLILNWKTGTVLGKLSIQSFQMTFLNAHILIVAKNGADDTSQPGVPHLELFDLRFLQQPGSALSDFSALVPILRLDLLKDLEPGPDSTDHYPNWLILKTGSTGVGTSPDLEPLFTQDPRHDILVIKLRFIHPRFIVTSAGALLDFLSMNTPTIPTTTPPALVTRAFAIHEWPNCTFFHPDHSRDAPASTCGSRLMIPSISKTDPAQRSFYLFDFNTRPWRRELGGEFKPLENDLLPMDFSSHQGFPVPHIRRIISPSCTGIWLNLTEDRWISLVRGSGCNWNLGHAVIFRTELNENDYGS
ncbi:hypothetical protein BDN72DRAFT_324071 [Pluteus cervinus]|uniref:Uncharacterized protein n=1 Tax=Pluteus cervinus TaxID=181527 RepID=A0ACD3ABU2_9AGAR|nr:hypothetical protein BDN72DRAFT_324071 [Pluteus cervinus]